MGVPAAVGLAGSLLVAAPPLRPVLAVGAVPARRRVDGAAQHTRHFRDGARDQACLQAGRGSRGPGAATIFPGSWTARGARRRAAHRRGPGRSHASSLPQQDRTGLGYQPLPVRSQATATLVLRALFAGWPWRV